MKSRYRSIGWLCLVAYLWAATGLSDAVSLKTLVNEHGHGSIVFEPAADAELIVHHVGHRDAHEPHTIDTAYKQCEGDTSQGHSHADHVLKLDGTKQTNGFLAKDLKVPKFLDDELLTITPVIDPLSPRSMHVALQACPSRNSALAFVKLTQLLI